MKENTKGNKREKEKEREKKHLKAWEVESDEKNNTVIRKWRGVARVRTENEVRKVNSEVGKL